MSTQNSQNSGPLTPRERIAVQEAMQAATGKRIDELDAKVDKRLTDLDAKVDKRSDQTDAKIDTITAAVNEMHATVATVNSTVAKNVVTWPKLGAAVVSLILAVCAILGATGHLPR
ncbi:MAG: hypothetical protein ACYCW6_00115 [Candidatus Xenobia bacterium]